MVGNLLGSNSVSIRKDNEEIFEDDGGVKKKGVITIDVAHQIKAEDGFNALSVSTIMEAYDDIPKDDKSLYMCLGVTDIGQPYFINFDNPITSHIFLAGQTGSGKSYSLYGLFIPMLFKYSPEELDIRLIDMKNGGFVNIFQKFPHCKSFITKYKGIVEYLKEINREIEAVYNKFEEACDFMEKENNGIRPVITNINNYNELYASVYHKEKLKRHLIIIDELDLLFNSDSISYAYDVDDPKRLVNSMKMSVKNLIQVGRAAGFNAYLGSQRPSTIGEGIFKTYIANTGVKIAMKINDINDAKIMVGNDYYRWLTTIENAGVAYVFNAADSPIPTRIQIPFIRSEEVSRLSTFFT